MRNKILAAVSLLSLMTAHPLLAADYSGKNKLTQREIEDIRAAYIDNDDSTDVSIINISPHRTAEGIINQSVYNVKGDTIGTIHDIIINNNGNADLVIVKDSQIFGLGKIAAFDYHVLIKLDDDGDMLSSLNENSIKLAKEFSYKKSDESSSISVMPQNGYSVLQLLSGQLVNQKNKVVAQVDNMIFRNGKVDNLIVTFDTVLSFGGNRAALPFKDVQLIRDRDGYDFKLSAAQAKQFDTYKKITK
jgi:sporulation protein YlmC with PRC-barrel domain